MSDGKSPLAPTQTSQQWDPELIFFILSHSLRRRLLFALARGGPQPASALSPGGGLRLECAFKQLAAMRDAGLVVLTPNPKDRRKQLYGLSPSVRVTKTETGCEIDFGFCQLQA